MDVETPGNGVSYGLFTTSFIPNKFVQCPFNVCQMKVVKCNVTHELTSGSGPGSGVGVFTTMDGAGVETFVASDDSGSCTEGSGVVTLAGGDWTGGGVEIGVATGVFTSVT